MFLRLICRVGLLPYRSSLNYYLLDWLLVIMLHLIFAGGPGGIVGGFLGFGRGPSGVFRWGMG